MDRPPTDVLADEVRRLIERLQLSAVRDEAAVEIADRVRRIADAVPNDGRRTWHPDTDMHPDANCRTDGTFVSLNHQRDPVVGTRNPVAPPLAIEVVESHDGPRLRGEVTLSATYEGAPRTVHGGIVCAVMDEMLGMAQQVLPIAGYTGTITIRFRAPTPTYTRLIAEAWMDRIDGRKIFMAGTLHAADVLCAEAEGIFISPKGSRETS